MHALSGGAGFGVDPELTVPIVPGPAARAGSIGELAAVLLAAWNPTRHGPVFERAERLTFRFAAEPPGRDAVATALRSAGVPAVDAAGAARAGSCSVADADALRRLLAAATRAGVTLA